MLCSMWGKRNHAAIAAALAMIGTASFAAPADTLAIRALPSAAHYIPLSQPSDQTDQTGFEPDPDAKADKAIQAFGRVLAQAAASDQEQIQAQCKAGEPPNQTPEQRYAWAANCRYSRH